MLKITVFYEKNSHCEGINDPVITWYLIYQSPFKSQDEFHRYIIVYATNIRIQRWLIKEYQKKSVNQVSEWNVYYCTFTILEKRFIGNLVDLHTTGTYEGMFETPYMVI